MFGMLDLFRYISPKMNVRAIFFNTTCHSRSLSKWAKLPFSSSAMKIDAPLDLIHGDV